MKMGVEHSLLSAVLWLCLLFRLPCGLASEPLKPIIIIPGIAGSGLLGSREADAPVEGCSKKATSNFRLWASYEELLTDQECWTHMLEMSFDDSTMLYSNKTGVSIEPEDFGGTHGIAFLDYVAGYGVVGTKYMYEFLEGLHSVGYEEGKTLRALTYDWRLPPNQVNLGGFRIVIEESVKTTGQKALLVGHSLGTLYMNYFLNKEVDADWKAKHIEKFVAVSGTYGGGL
uniref:Lecithin:cholesterol acyltransferase n=1 Tax=Vitrella brassicaformis TaxID=1169539 RepID=A0A7S1JTV5_9ALVE|mmetsp:Transcript_24314/g.59997  ORF Transcript_24314/g.59997 Transcript_24314/m.59997 type:complete len:229 (+) Transcript_24314:118-804(+)